MFIIGCFVPFLWVTNVLYLSDKIENPDNIESRKWYYYSLIGVAIVGVLFAIWIALFQSFWTEWKASSFLIWLPNDVKLGW